MQTEYKPTLRFNAVETRRINVAADKMDMKPSEWMRKLILDHAPVLGIAEPLAVRVAGFEEPNGWNLIHFTDTILHAQTIQYDKAEEIQTYMEPYTSTHDGEIWIDGNKLPGVAGGDVTSISARAMDLVRSIYLAHIRAGLNSGTL